MYRLLLLLAVLSFLSISNGALAQNFEGIITYKIDAEVLPGAAHMGMTKEMMIERMKNAGLWADSERITYKDGSYRIDRISTKKNWSIYRSDSNKIFAFQDSSNLCTVLNASIDLEAVTLNQSPKVIMLDSLVNINNKPCWGVRIQWHSGYYDYFYSKNFLPMNPELYKNHIYNGWYSYLKIAKSLPVQFKTELNGMMVVTYTITSYKEKKIPADIFKIPALIPNDPSLPSLPNQVVMKIKN